ncbi:MAG: AEC family transporter [Bacteroidetes bacterium]|nr:AEC family transporter [Bacteroidota bacterium]
MEGTGIIINQILILGIVSVVGVIAAKIGVISEGLRDGIAKLVFNITLPLNIFTSFTAMQSSGELLRNASMVILYAYLAFFLLFLIGKLSSVLFKMDSKTGTIHILHTVFGNHGFLGFPLLSALFPDGQGIFYASFVFVASSSILWTLGVYMLNTGKRISFKERMIQLFNPNTIAFIVGITFMLFEIRLPNLLQSSLGGLGKTTNYLAMLYIGALLAKANFKSIIKHKHVFMLAFNKLLLVPVVMMFLITYFNALLPFDISHVAKSVVILQAGMPCMAIIVILAKKYNSDDMLATENVFVTTVLSIATLPFLYFLISLLSS